MTLSLYAFFMAVVWFSAFILFATLLQHKTGLVVSGQLGPLLVLLGLTVFRLFVPVEFPFAQVISCATIYPELRDFLFAPWLTVNGAGIPGMYVILSVWIAGSVVQCVRLCLQLYRDRRAIQELPAVESPELEQHLRALRTGHRHTKRVYLIVSPCIASPMLAGLLRPSILLPQTCAELSAQEVRCILTHELTHLSNGDLWVKLLVRLLCCLMWWNPCVYLLQKDLDRILEYKCDMAVTKTMREQEKGTYVQTILNAFGRMDRSSSALEGQALQASFCGIPEKTVLQNRFYLILNQKRKKRLSSAAFLTMLLLLFAASYTVVLQPASEPPAEDFAGGEVLITPETAYIRVEPNGDYYLIYEGSIFQKLTPTLLLDRPFCDMIIKNENEVA